MGGAEIVGMLMALMVLLAPIAAIVAVVTGVMARKQIARSDGELKGRGMAMAGIVTGTISLLVAAGITALMVVMATSWNRTMTAQQAAAERAINAPLEAEMDVTPADDESFEEEIVEDADEKVVEEATEDE